MRPEIRLISDILSHTFSKYASVTYIIGKYIILARNIPEMIICYGYAIISGVSRC